MGESLAQKRMPWRTGQRGPCPRAALKLSAKVLLQLADSLVCCGDLSTELCA
jgi:hypothetical protein